MTNLDFHGIQAASAIDALVMAAGAGKIKEMRLLLDDGTDINGIASFSESTPLATAAEYGVLKSISFLLESGADIDRPGANDMTPLMHACSCGGRKGSQVADALIRASDTAFATFCCSDAKSTPLPPSGNNLLRLTIDQRNLFAKPLKQSVSHKHVANSGRVM